MRLAFLFQFSLPLRESVFEDRVSRSFFANLIPESEIRDLIAGKYGFSSKNDFEFFKGFGGECAGALSIISDDMKNEFNQEPSNYKLFDDNSLKAIIEAMDRRPLLISEEGLRLSLAGAQHKLPVFMMMIKYFYLLEGMPVRILLSRRLIGLKILLKMKCFVCSLRLD